MNGFLRQSTASQARLIGPFLDDTDFKTPETGLTIANTDIKLRANGTTLSNKNSGGGTHQVNGEYSVTFDATDTANVGQLKYNVTVSGALPVFGVFTVLEEAVYDAFFAASAAGYNASQVVASVTGAVGSVTGAVGSVTGAVGSVTGAVGSVAGNVDGNVTGSVGSLAAQAKADVNAEVVDTLATDTYAESTGVPAATASLALKIRWLATLARNKMTQTSTTLTLRNDADSGNISTATVSDNGTTFTRGEFS